MGVQRVHVVLPVSVSHTEEVRDVRNQDVTKVLKAELHTARLTGEEGGAKLWVAPKVLKERQIIA